MDIERDDNDAMIASRRTRGSTHRCRQRLPQAVTKDVNGKHINVLNTLYMSNMEGLSSLNTI